MGEVPADWPEGIPFYKWPPFPAKPEGVTIIPFSQFVATGLRVDQDDDDAPAVDQEGIPTTGLQARHDGEKKKRRRKKKNEKGEIVEVPLAWWEELEEDTKSSNPVYKYDYREPYLDRLVQAWKDFSEKRRFPTHVQAVAHALGICLGIVDPNPTGVKTNKKAGSDDDDGDGDADAGSDDDFGDDEGKGDASGAPPPPPVTQDLYDADLKPETAREKAIDAFFQDPERVTKLFLTSYAYDKGIYWNEAKLRDSPILVEAFLNFLEVNQVFRPEEKSTRFGIAQGKKVAQLAKEEMPHANKLANVLPDSWGKACGALWGQRLSGPNTWVFGQLPDEAAPTANEGAPDGTPPAQPQPDVTGDAMLFEPTDAELLIDAIEPPSINGVQTEWTNTSGDAATSNGWGSSNAWGPGTGEGGGWGDDEEDVGEGDNSGENPTWDADAFMEPPAPDPETIWGSFAPSGHEQLEALIGPNSLAKTYVTLRVEIGSRVIGTLVEPPANAIAPPEGAPFADLVQQRFARLTLSPSRFLKTAPAYGACITKSDMMGTPIDESKFGWVGPHDPNENDITVFVTANEDLLDVLRKGAGMTITGTFVQVAELASPKEDEPAEAEPTGEPAKKKKKKKGKKDATTSVRSWWFLYQLTQVFPTFYEQ